MATSIRRPKVTVLCIPRGSCFALARVCAWFSSSSSENIRSRCCALICSHRCSKCLYISHLARQVTAAAAATFSSEKPRLKGLSRSLNSPCYIAFEGNSNLFSSKLSLYTNKQTNKQSRRLISNFLLYVRWESLAGDFDALCEFTHIQLLLTNNLAPNTQPTNCSSRENR